MREETQNQKILDWYNQYSSDIYRFIFMMIGDQEQAKDLTHDTYLKAYKSLIHYKNETSDKNWLYRLARHVTIDYMRKKKPLLYMVETFAIIKIDPNCPEKLTQLDENEQYLYRSLRRLKRSYREVIILRKVKELSIKETSEVLNWSESKVKVTLLRALSALKKQLEEEGYEHEAF
ncbi:RNA polymerase sigma factor [Halalkalibacter akibai]|uniref:RNA polymerase sigma-70 factor n=1 Tax=Halalkalibacter akibai (strain ATCC 43226 / DSM 21942 / CIP 109018 / JCM 9157 / 1139) TaxID=1236973 RepID=W4QTY7_HALA3|nr:RNA polymerase sigma factor [Halalkalibacter akibai]GAE35536.1 RNA polymerase sigma-70 factor [Halalkalibacter akibai JCM 9157]